MRLDLIRYPAATTLFREVPVPCFFKYTIVPFQVLVPGKLSAGADSLHLNYSYDASPPPQINVSCGPIIKEN
jgi:hypothetical protein